MQLFNINNKGEMISIDKLDFDDNDVYLVDDIEKNTIYIWVGTDVEQNKKDITADIARKIDKERGGSAKILIMKQKREYGPFLTMMNDLKKGNIPGKTIERRPEFIFKAPPKTIRSNGFEEKSEEKIINLEERITKWLQQIKEHRVFEPDKEEKESIDVIKFIKFKESYEETQTEAKAEVEQSLEQSEKQIEIEPEFVEAEPEELDLRTQIKEAAYFLSLDRYSYNDLCWMLAEKIQKMNLDMPSIEDIKQKAEEVFSSSCTYDELCWLNAEMDILIKQSFLEKEKKQFKY